MLLHIDPRSAAQHDRYIIGEMTRAQPYQLGERRGRSLEIERAIAIQPDVTVITIAVAWP